MEKGHRFIEHLTDMAACLGNQQLKRAEPMRRQREAIANYYIQALKSVEELELPTVLPKRLHAWHLFPIRLQLDRLQIDRNRFLELLKDHGVGCSVHWRPLHLHPYYETTSGWIPEDFPVATQEWERLISLPLFPGMTAEERDHVVGVVRGLCESYAV
jgi:perosamine synthetase